jgi:hypothetical protein
MQHKNAVMQHFLAALEFPAGQLVERRPEKRAPVIAKADAIK